jgi:hypothetical protein
MGEVFLNLGKRLRCEKLFDFKRQFKERGLAE